MKDRVKISGKVMVEWLENDVVVKRQEFKNKVTTLGLALFASLMAGTGTAPSYIAMGTGFAAAAAGDLTLGAEVARASILSVTHPSNAVQYTATFAPGVATGTLREAGLLNAPSGGTLSNRVVFSIPLVKLSYQTINIIWLVSLSN